MEDRKPFEIRVALVGYVSVGKSTVLNALLGDKFSEVNMRRTTAGVNCFRIQQPEDEEDGNDGVEISDKEQQQEDEHETKRRKTEDEKDDTVVVDTHLNNDDDDSIKNGKRKRRTESRSAESTHAEISKDNQALRSSDSEDVMERFFDIRIVDKPICKMRKDTQLVLIDIPGMNEADSSKKYKDYVESNWNSFDCVVVVMDAIQGVNTQEQVELLKFVQENNTNLKHIPTIILGNKVDDPEDFENHVLVQEAREKATEIFGSACSKEELKELLHIAKNCNYVPDNTKMAVFIPISAMNAFIYRKASHLTLDSFHEFDKDVMETIGRDEVGRRWKKMSTEEKVIVIQEAISDPDEYKERLAGTNFDHFLTVLTYFIGGRSAQRDLLTSQIDVSLKTLSQNRKNKTSIAESIHGIFQKSKVVGRSTDDLKDTFWRVYKQCEDDSFKKVEKEIDPKFLQQPITELEKYQELAVILEWDEELTIVRIHMKGLLRRLLQLIIAKEKAWSISGFLDESRKEVKQPYNVEIVWKMPEKLQWTNLSPHDWITILFSVTLASKNIEFCQSFGRELRLIEESLLHFRTHFSPRVLLVAGDFPYDPDISCIRDYITAYQEIDDKTDAGCTDEDNIHKRDAIMKLEMPEELSDPSHWGHIAWKYVHVLSKISS